MGAWGVEGLKACREVWGVVMQGFMKAGQCGSRGRMWDTCSKLSGRLCACAACMGCAFGLPVASHQANRVVDFHAMQPAGNLA